MSNSRYIAHVRFDDNGNAVEHWLEDHLRKVAGLSAKHACVFGSEDWAEIAGRWHDLGKYGLGFQKYIKKATGYEAQEAHIETKPERVNHSTAGASYALEKLGITGRVIAYLIAGHHAGLPDWHKVDGVKGGALHDRLADKTHLQKALSQDIPDSVLSFEIPHTPPIGDSEGFALWVRMLFSSLVDADFLDTESFMDERKSERRGNYASLDELQDNFNAEMEKLVSKAADTKVNKIRQDILRQCRYKAFHDSGVFSLTVPTGGGKTLSSMAFALDHAVILNKKRIIYVIPYTSIIEQTAKVFKDIFGEENVIEHHSNVDPDDLEKENSRSRLATENWDAPIIVTTTVQYFESLHAARTSRCRKLHNIANSVVILDEIQLLPPELLCPILRVIRLLSEHYNVTHVLSTATQPALKSQYDPFGRTICKGLDDATEIIDNTKVLYQQLERVRLELPDDFQTPTDWETLAEELEKFGSILVIVNRRQDARDLHALMPKGTYHLSALMCAQHRSLVIDAIKEELKQGLTVKVISTQLVEAGVDMDFPVVYRAMAGLDSIAQAAGRCNREGKLQKDGKDIKGKVVVFIPPKPSIGLLGKAAQSAISLLSNYSGNPLEPDLFTNFFDHFYNKTDPDKKQINKLLTPDEKLECQFRTAAQEFQMIEEKDTQTIFVKYDDQSTAWLDQLERNGPERWLMRKLQRYTVTLYRCQFEQLVDTGDIKEIWEGIYAQYTDTLYEHEIIGLGLLLSSEPPSTSTLILT